MMQFNPIIQKSVNKFSHLQNNN